MPCRPRSAPSPTAACSPRYAIRPVASMAAPSSPGVAAVTAGEKAGTGIPKSVVTDGPVVTKENAAGMQWMEDSFS